MPVSAPFSFNYFGSNHTYSLVVIALLLVLSLSLSFLSCSSYPFTPPLPNSMDEQHHQNQPYSMADFRHLMAEAPPHPEMFPSHHQILQPVEMMTAVAGHGQMQVHGCTSGGLHEFPANPSAAAAAFEGGDGGRSMRWPRHETLTLLEIRSRLDSRFREANQRGPLWDEVSRYCLCTLKYKTLFRLMPLPPPPLFLSFFFFSISLRT